MNSQDYLNQIQSMGTMPNYQEQFTKAYETPVLKPLVDERAQLESQYLPSLFQPFANMGTGAADMSPAAKLALVGGSIGRLGGLIGANNSIQNYYGGQINDLANRAGQDWQGRQQNLQFLYNAKAQEEQANRAAGGGGLGDILSLLQESEDNTPAIGNISQTAAAQGGTLANVRRALQSGLTPNDPRVAPVLNILGKSGYDINALLRSYGYN